MTIRPQEYYESIFDAEGWTLMNTSKRHAKQDSLTDDIYSFILQFEKV